MTNRDFINKLMNYPLDATIDISCGSCAHATLYSGKSEPNITCNGSTYKTLSIKINEGFKGEKVDLSVVPSDVLLNEIEKRMNKN